MINFNITKWFRNRKAKKQQIKQTVEKVTNEYNDLINEYRLIQEKKSGLSRRQRDFVELRIKHLITKGHIQVNG